MFKNILYYTIFFLTVVPFYFGMVIPVTVLRILKKGEASERFLKKYSRFYFKLLLNLSGSTLTVTGEENLPGLRKDICVVGNHQSYFDILILEAALPFLVGFVAKKELSRIPVLSRWMKELGCVIIERSSPKSAVKAIERGVDSIKSGKALVIFPEGTRSKSQKMGRMKPGSLKLAIRSGALIVPVTINSSYKIFEENSRIRGSRVSLVIHKPVDTALSENQDSLKLAEKLQNIISGGLLSG